MQQVNLLKQLKQQKTNTLNLKLKTMATKTWQINTLQRELADGYVNKVIYRVNGEDGTYKFRATGEVNLPKPDTLVPYGDLTEATVLGLSLIHI